MYFTILALLSITTAYFDEFFSFFLERWMALHQINGIFYAFSVANCDSNSKNLNSFGDNKSTLLMGLCKEIVLKDEYHLSSLSHFPILKASVASMIFSNAGGWAHVLVHLGKAILYYDQCNLMKVRIQLKGTPCMGTAALDRYLSVHGAQCYGTSFIFYPLHHVISNKNS